MDTILKDLRYAVRTLLKHPAFTATAVLTIALGIGVTTAIFSVVNALILNPLLMHDPDRVVAVWRTSTEERREGYVSYLDLQDWRTRTQSFEDIAAYKSHDFDATTNNEAERLPGMRVTANFLPLLKVNPLRGRNFVEAEDKRGAQLVTIISHDLWQNAFGGNDDILSQQIMLDGKSHTIVGVLPENYQFPLLAKHAQVLTTIVGEGGNLPERGAQVFRAVGRLKPGLEPLRC